MTESDGCLICYSPRMKTLDTHTLVGGLGFCLLYAAFIMPALSNLAGDISGRDIKNE